MGLWVAGVDPAGQLGVGLGGNCDCRCGVLYAPTLGGGRFAGLGGLHLLLNLRNFSFPAGGGGGVISGPGLLCVLFLTEFTSPYRMSFLIKQSDNK